MEQESDGWKDRVREEFGLLTGKIDELGSFINTNEFDVLSREDQLLIFSQLNTMKTYSNILAIRMTKF